MEKSKLIQLLRSMSKKEFSDLEYYIKSPCHNRDKDAIKLYMSLKSAYPEFKHFRINKERIAKMVFGEASKENTRVLKYPMSVLTQKTENYLIACYLDRQKNKKDELLLNIFQKRGLDNIFFKKIEETKRRLKNKPEIAPENYLFQYHLNTLLYRHPNNQRLTTSMQSTLQEKNYFLDLFYFSTKLNEKLIILNRNIVINEERQLLFIKEIIEQVEHNPQFSELPLFVIYRFFIRYLPHVEQFNYKDFSGTKDLIFQQLSTFGENEQINILLLFLQYAIQVHEKGIANLLQEHFDIYSFGINHKILYTDKHIMPFIFFNTVQAACELGRLEWAKHFINEQSKYLHKTHQENITLLSKAYLNCCQTNYDEALVCMREINYKKHYYYDILIRMIRIRCFFEQKETELLHNYISATYIFIRRHKEMSSPLKERVNNFTRFVELLDKNKYSKQFTNQELQKKLSQEQNISFRSWLLKKVSISPIRV